MYAIVEIAGKQYRVEQDMKLKVARLDSKPGDKIGFDQILYIEDDKGNPTIGKPYVKDMAVNVTVIEHGRGKKVIVFKKKRRKGYQKTYGHRQGYSLVEINKIAAAPAKKPKTAAEKPSAAEKKDTKKTAAGATKSTKTAAAKKTTTKKTAPKKTTTKKTTKQATNKKAASTVKKPAAKKSAAAKSKKPPAKKEAKEE